MRSLLALLCALYPAAVLAAVEGTVLSATGTPIEHARVETGDGGEVTYSDRHGRFVIAGLEPPAEITVSHPRFEIVQVVVASPQDLPLEVRLTSKLEIYENVAVSANRGEQNFSPISVASDDIDPADSIAPPSSLVELITAVPSVAENGQGGLFQAYSIRGVSRQRVLTLISGMRIVGERRAGVSTSFIDPLLLGNVDVLRGPSSTYYGSGALGGVVQLFPRRFEQLSLVAGYDSQGDENFQVVGWGDGDWSLGLARRQAEGSETPAGQELFSGFGQLSSVASRRWSRGELDFGLQAIVSRGSDIEKANTDYPERQTTYPDERHLLVRFDVAGPGSWRFDAWVHPNSLDTEVVEAGVERSDLENEAFDLGFDWQREVAVGDRGTSRFGIDYFGRRSVTVNEVISDLSGAETPDLRQATLDGAEEDELGLYGAFEWNPGRVTVLAGARFAWQSQKNGDEPGTDDGALSGFAGFVAPLGAGFELVGNLGTGLRFPSLSERFFSGTTGRGVVIGNADLEPERSLNVDTGLRWYGNRLFVAAYVFRNEIDDYIERIEIADNLLTFRNLVSGTIEGLELDAFLQASAAWSFSLGGQTMEGRSEADEPLADIPADRVYTTARWAGSRWSWEDRWEHRFSKDDFGSGEKPIPAADLVSAAVGYRVRDGLELRLTASNLLDEEFFNSADRKVPLAAGRSIGLSISWTRLD